MCNSEFIHKIRFQCRACICVCVCVSCVSSFRIMCVWLVSPFSVSRERIRKTKIATLCAFKCILHFFLFFFLSLFFCLFVMTKRTYRKRGEGKWISVLFRSLSVSAWVVAFSGTSHFRASGSDRVIVCGEGLKTVRAYGRVWRARRSS